LSWSNLPALEKTAKKQTPQAKVCGVCQFFIGACLKTGGMPRPHSNSFLILFSFKKKEWLPSLYFFRL
jgi:hypothetical protein